MVKVQISQPKCTHMVVNINIYVFACVLHFCLCFLRGVANTLKEKHQNLMCDAHAEINKFLLGVAHLFFAVGHDCYCIHLPILSLQTSSSLSYFMLLCFFLKKVCILNEAL